MSYANERRGSPSKGQPSCIVDSNLESCALLRRGTSALALLVREMREDAGLTQTELARKVSTTQSVIVRLEDAEYVGHSLTMLERIATACGVALKLHAEKSPISTVRSR